MSHEAIQELLSSYLDGDLSADERGQVDEHLATCEACQQELALLRATLDALHGLPELTAPAGFADAVMDRVLAEAPTVGATVVPLRRRLPVLLMAAPAALAAAAVLMVGMVWWLAPRYQAGEPGVVASRGDAAEQEEKAGVERALKEAAMTMQVALLAATEMGLGSCWMAGINHERVELALPMPDGARVVAISSLGEPPRKMGLSWDAMTFHLISKRRKPLDAIRMTERWRKGA